MRLWMRRCLAAAASLICASAYAGESLQELTHRGAQLRELEAAGLIVQSVGISIGIQNSSIKYLIANPTGALITATLTLPLPDLDFTDPDATWSIPAPDPVNFVALTMKIDQKPATAAFSQIAQANSKEIGPALRRNGLSFVPVGGFQNQIAALTPDAQMRLAGEGLIAQEGTDLAGNPLYSPRWSVKTFASHKINLPPGKTTIVEFSFRTSVGISRDSVLREPLRSQKGLAGEVERRRSAYCVDHAFLAGVDKIVTVAATRLTTPQDPGLPNASDLDPAQQAPSQGERATPLVRVFPEANVADLRERRISFDLGADTPEAPLPQFRLAVDKGKFDRVVSFCMNNLKKISPTGFEMRATNYRPAGLLGILLVGPKN